MFQSEFPFKNRHAVRCHFEHLMFSLMGFSDSYPIKINPFDAEKTVFRTPMGNFHYTDMLFGLKNTGATYQREMTVIFHDLSHDCFEDYVDDTIMKSKKPSNILMI